MGPVTSGAGFAERLAARRRLVGVFQKTPHYQITELLALTGIDFVVLDTEHSQFDPSQLDSCVLASRAAALPLLVRVSRNAPDAILAALDTGATGVLVPHVTCADEALRAVSAARYLSGSRGLSPSTRAGGYGTRGLRNHMELADRETVVIAQIEDADALGKLDDIASVPGLSGMFVGRADLAASMRLDWEHPLLDDATISIARAAAAAAIPCGAFLGSPEKSAQYVQWGVDFFIIGSDQSALRAEISRITRTSQETARDR